MENKVILPARKTHFTPRLLRSDAYTIGADKFQSDKAKEKSVYYTVFRRELHKINPDLYKEGDNRIFFAGLQRILDRLFYEPITHDEIDRTKEYLSNFKVTPNGLTEYEFPESMWRDIVDNFNGRPPIKIEALPEGSIVYPHEPAVQVTSFVKDKKYGELAAWFESNILKVWSSSERLTQNQHWLNTMIDMVKEIDPTLTDDMILFFASLMEHDFGDRAGICEQESEDLGLVHLYTFPGTDTCSGGYQAWMNSNKTPGISVSVNALAHRNVQAYENEKECYETMYDKSNDNEFLSMVADCYDFKHAVKEYLLPLALKSKELNNGKIIVARPDSDDPLECVMYVCDIATANGLYEEREINGKKWKFSTYLKFIEGDGMDFATMKNIINELIKKGYAPYGWGLFGIGGGLRNNIKRDNTGAKYALCSIGSDDTGVIKLSENTAKMTLPGPFKLLRDEQSMNNNTTIVHESEEGENAMVVYYDGSNIYKPFGPGQDDDFNTIKNRIKQQMLSMPKDNKRNGGAPASDIIINKRNELIKKYAPSKYEKLVNIYEKK